MKKNSLSGKYMGKPEKEIQQKIEDFIDCIADAVIGVNQEGDIVLINLHAEKLFGYSRKELLGSRLEILLPDHLKNIHTNHRVSYFHSPHIRGMGQESELWGKKKDGTEFPVEVSLSPFKMGEETIAISAIRDATENKQRDE
jgi:protein-histidine pros-kinase